MKTKILMLVMVIAWTFCGAGDVRAEGLGDIPSTGEFVLIGVGVVFVLTFIVLAIVSAGDDEEAKGGEEEIQVSRIEPAAKVKLRIDPVLTLQKNAVGGGLCFSF